jgi:hypothetical protein
MNVTTRLIGERARILQGSGGEVLGEVAGGGLHGAGRHPSGFVLDFPQRSVNDRWMTDELDRIEPRESAHVKARDKKVQGPKVIAVNPGLKKLALHIAGERRKKAKPKPADG